MADIYISICICSVTSGFGYRINAQSKMYLYVLRVHDTSIRFLDSLLNKKLPLNIEERLVFEDRMNVNVVLLMILAILWPSWTCFSFVYSYFTGSNCQIWLSIGSLANVVYSCISLNVEAWNYGRGVAKAWSVIATTSAVPNASDRSLLLLDLRLVDNICRNKETVLWRQGLFVIRSVFEHVKFY